MKQVSRFILSANLGVTYVAVFVLYLIGYYVDIEGLKYSKL
jgi:hypothetical protein